MKKKFKPLGLLAKFLGLLGVVACAAAIIVVCAAGSRLTQINENVFDGIDKTLTAMRDRVVRAQTRVQQSKITTEDIGQSVRNWTAKEASEGLSSRLEVEAKAERLVMGLQQAELWLETSEVSIRGVQQALDVGRSLGAPVDAALVEPLLEQLGALRRQLRQSTETVDGIRQRVTESSEGEGLEKRIDEIGQLVLRVVATLGELDSRLGESADKAAYAQTKVQSLKSKTHSFVVIMTICAVMLIVWMMAGQISLCRSGIRRVATNGPGHSEQ